MASRGLPEEPAHYFIHKGDVVIDGGVSFGAGDDVDVTLHAIDGNLTVNGPLFFIRKATFGGACMWRAPIACDNAIIGVDAARLHVGRLA